MPVSRRTLIAADEVVDHEFRTILRNLITFMMEDPRTISSALTRMAVVAVQSCLVLFGMPYVLSS